MSVLSPKTWTTVQLDSLKKKWRLLGETFSNVMAMADVPELLSKVKEDCLVVIR